MEFLIHPDFRGSKLSIQHFIAIVQALVPVIELFPKRLEPNLSYHRKKLDVNYYVTSIGSLWSIAIEETKTPLVRYLEGGFITARIERAKNVDIAIFKPLK